MYYPIQDAIPQRRVNVVVKTKYSLYKGELQEDFVYKCGYCDTPDYYSGGRRGFHIDHFAPKSKFKSLGNSYGNLVYCCPICNIGKSNHWPGDDPTVSFVGDAGFVDPCSPDYQKHLARGVDGKIVALTPLGTYIHKKLRLSLRRRQICWLLDRMEKQMEQLKVLIRAKNFEDAVGVKAFVDLHDEYTKYVGILKRDE